MNEIIIQDIDGTLANINHRLHHIKPLPGHGSARGEKKNWSAFFHAAKEDAVYEHVKHMGALLKAQGHTIVLITGRPENFREDTIAWLGKNGIIYDTLLMRPANERKPDYEVKKDLLNAYLEKEGRVLSDVKMVFEDRLPVAKMWHDMGLHVLVCGSEWISSDWSD